MDVRRFHAAVQLTVVIPTYNEAENLPRLSAALFALPLPDLKILVVDDDSPDGTGKVADALAAEYPGRFEVLHRTEEKGFGKAYIAGFRYALAGGAQVIGQMDADLSHPPELLPQLVDALHDSDVALGSRYVPGGSVDERWPAWRKSLSSFGNFYARTILNLPVRDVTGGYRVWQRSALQNIPFERVRSNGYAFLIETLFLAYRLGYTFEQIPFYFADRRFGQSKMSLKVQREAALRVWQMRWEYRDIQPVKEHASA